MLKNDKFPLNEDFFFKIEIPQWNTLKINLRPQWLCGFCFGYQINIQNPPTQGILGEHIFIDLEMSSGNVLLFDLIFMEAQ